jgi:hypothetical protein
MNTRPDYMMYNQSNFFMINKKNLKYIENWDKMV